MSTLRSEALLRGYANPYAALDAKGMPTGTARHDPDHGRKGVIEHIGATITRTHILERDDRGKPIPVEPKASYVQPRVVHAFAYDLTPQLLPHTDYIVRLFKDRDIIAADEATAKLARVPWMQPSEVLAAARQAAIDLWTDTYGSPPPVATWPDHILGEMPVATATADAAPAVDPLEEILAELGAEFAPAQGVGLAKLALEAYHGDRNAAATSLAGFSTLYTVHRAQTLADAGVEPFVGDQQVPPGDILHAIARAVHTDGADLAKLVPPRTVALVRHAVTIFATTQGADALHAYFAPPPPPPPAAPDLTPTNPSPTPAADGGST